MSLFYSENVHLVDSQADDKPRKQRRPDRVLYQTPSAKGSKTSANERRSKNADEVSREEQRPHSQQVRSEEGSLRRQLPDVVSDIGENPISAKPSAEILATGSSSMESLKTVANTANSASNAKNLANASSLREHLAKSIVVAGSNVTSSNSDQSVASSLSEQSVSAQQSTTELPRRALGRGRNRAADEVKVQPLIQSPTVSSSVLFPSVVAEAPGDNSTGITAGPRQLSDFYRAKNDVSMPGSQNTSQQLIATPPASDVLQPATKPDAFQSNVVPETKRSIPERPRPSQTAVAGSLSKTSAAVDAKVVQKYEYGLPEDEKYIPDEDVKESVNARTFQGLVFTSSRPDDRSSSALKTDKKGTVEQHNVSRQQLEQKKGGGQLYEERADDNRGKSAPTRQDSSKKHVSYSGIAADEDSRRDSGRDASYNSRSSEQRKASTRTTPDRAIVPPSQAENRRGRNNSERSSLSDDRIPSTKNATDRRGGEDSHAYVNQRDRGQGRLEETEYPQAAKGGGILHLPPTQMKQMTSQASDVSQARRSPGVKTTQAPSQQVPRGPSGRTLYDPNNPTDHHRSSPSDSHFVDSPKQQQLHFIETGDVKQDVTPPPFAGTYGGGRNFPMQPYGQGPMPMMWHPGMRPLDPSYAYPPPNYFPYRPGGYPV